jgi:hypothetical protein
MFVHAVYFWLRDDLTEAEKDAFRKGVNALATIESVEHCYVGVPADTDRPVIDRSYSYALVVVFADQEGHDLYQAHPVHDRFRVDCAPYWERVLIYDSVDESDS